jgi:hypothetical protein
VCTRDRSTSGTCGSGSDSDGGWGSDSSRCNICIMCIENMSSSMSALVRSIN